MRLVRRLEVCLARLARRRLERAQLGLGPVDRLEPGGELLHQRGQFIDLAAMLAGKRAQIEQPGLGRLQRSRIVHQRLGGRLELRLGLARLDHRPVKRRQRFGEQRVLGRDPVQFARGDAQGGERRIRTLPDMAQLVEIAREALALLHAGAGAGELGLLAHHGHERSQFGEMRARELFLGFRRLDLAAPLGQHRLGLRPGGIGAGEPIEIGSGIAIEQRAVAARIDEAAIIVLAVKLDQRGREFTQGARADGLVVDEGLGPAIGSDLAADDQRLARLKLDLALVQHLNDRGRQGARIETRGDARLLLSRAHEPGFGAIAQHEAERIEQDRLARPRLPGEHAEPAREIKVERFDQDDVADREACEHEQGRR